MLFSVEQAFVGRDEKRAPLKRLRGRLFEYIHMSLLLRVRGFYLSNKQEKNYQKIVWIAEIAASQIVADRKGNTFIVEKIVRSCYAFYYYHCYLIKHFGNTKH